MIFSPKNAFYAFGYCYIGLILVGILFFDYIEYIHCSINIFILIILYCSYMALNIKNEILKSFMELCFFASCTLFVARIFDFKLFGLFGLVRELF